MKTNNLSIRPCHQIQKGICYSSRDWSIDMNDAWIYAIAVGWGSSLNEVAKLHGWNDDLICFLKKTRKKFLSYEQHEKP